MQCYFSSLQFKRAPGPKNRRTPSRQSLKRNSGSPEARGPNLQHIAEDDAEKNELANHHDDEEEDEDDDEDVNHNPTKPSVKFLELHHNENNCNVLDQSPQGNHKPYIPPLDLSILHEHGDGNGKQAYTVSLQKNIYL